MPQTADGLHYEERGSGAPILCIHGAGSSSALWTAALEALGRFGRAIAYDRRGYGRSERSDPLPPMSVGGHTEDALALLEALGATPAVIVGRSYGGQIGIDLALRHPEKVRALVLLEGVPESFDPGARRWLEGIVAGALAAEGEGPGAVARSLLDEVLGPGGFDGLPQPVQAVFVHNEPAILAEFRGEYLLDVDPDALGAIRAPTLIVTAAASPDAFRRANERAAAAMPGARLEVIEGTHLIDPADPVVLGFLGEVLAAPAPVATG